MPALILKFVLVFKRMQCKALKHATLNVRGDFVQASSCNCKQMSIKKEVG